jgi:hypothetical protein
LVPGFGAWQGGSGVRDRRPRPCGKNIKDSSLTCSLKPFDSLVASRYVARRKT